MNATTQARTSRADSLKDSQADLPAYGDVDANGDLIDSPGVRAAARERRLAAAICPDSPVRARVQLEAITATLIRCPA